MRVALVVEQLLAPVPGGTGRYAAELGASLARTAGSGDHVAGWTAWHRDVTPARVDGLSGPHRLALARRPLTLAWERGLGPDPRDADLLHAPTPLFPPARRARLVVTIHDTVPWTHPETLTPRGAHWHRAMAERAAIAADAVTVPTRAVADDLLGRLPGLTPERVHVLGAGVAAALLAEPDPATVARVSAELPGQYLLSVATLEPRKGLDVLIAALARLGPQAPPLLVVGQPGWGGVDIGAAAAAAGLPPGAVRQLGRLSDGDLGVVLRRAAALVAPARAEGFGLPVAEAMAVGTPVIASDIPALAEVAGDAAVLVPPDDPAALAGAVDELLGDEATLRKLADAGRIRAARYDWDAVARRAWALYRALA